MYRQTLALLASFGLIAGADAFTPESGTWWNPNESGRGYLIEIQDNQLFFAGYIYSGSDRTPTWVTAGGPLDGNSRFFGPLLYSSGGQCVGCSYTQPTVSLSSLGNIEILFDTETRGRIRWAGVQTPIERFNYGYGNKERLMLGEWHTVSDFTGYPGVQYPYRAEVLVFDLIEDRPSPNADLFLGCRAQRMLDAGCTQQALDFNDATGFYRTSNGEHVIIVNDSTNYFIAYYVIVGSESFEGVLDLYLKGTSGSGFTYPVRGQRTASRARVVTGIGPDSDENGKAATGPVSLLEGLDLSRLGEAGGLTAAQVKSRYGMDLQALRASAQELMAVRLTTKRATQPR